MPLHSSLSNKSETLSQKKKVGYYKKDFYSLWPRILLREGGLQEAGAQLLGSCWPLLSTAHPRPHFSTLYLVYQAAGCH